MLDPEDQRLKEGHRGAMAGFGVSVVKSPEDDKADKELMAGVDTRPLFGSS